MFAEWECPAMASALVLALRELEAAPRSAPAVLLALLHTRFAREEATLAQALEEGRVGGLQRTRDAQRQGAGLAVRAAAVDVRVDVVRVGSLEQRERRLRLVGVAQRAEVLVHRPAVDLVATGAGLDAHARHRALPATETEDELCAHRISFSTRTGFCAVCGCSGPA